MFCLFLSFEALVKHWLERDFEMILMSVDDGCLDLFARILLPQASRVTTVLLERRQSSCHGIIINLSARGQVGSDLLPWNMVSHNGPVSIRIRAQGQGSVRAV